MRRRTLLELGVGAIAAAAVGELPPWLSPARADPLPGPFAHGVASGDPMPDRVILWTRVTPTADATPGSGLGDPVDVTCEVATDAAFADIVATTTATADADGDHTVKVDVDGLDPATVYWYRFRALDATSIVGATRTAPAIGDDPGSLRMGVVSCSNWEGGFFGAYRLLAERGDLDLVVHLGDYLYEYPADTYGPGSTIGRVHEPAGEMSGLAACRQRHGQYKTDADLRSLHVAVPWIAIWDDHEVANDRWADGPGATGANPDPTWVARRDAAYKAYFEWMPVRATGGSDDPYRIHRTLAWGTLADFVLLDERTFRSAQVPGARGDLLVTDPAVADPARTMLGADQLAWLADTLSASTATWKVVGNEVMFSPLTLGPDLPPIPGVADLVQSLVGTPTLTRPLVVNGDQWDGYQAEQATVAAMLDGVDGALLLTGDIHSSWVSEVPGPDHAAFAPGTGVANELVVPSVTSNSLDEGLRGLGLADSQVTLVEAGVTIVDPWFAYADLSQHGAGVVDLDATGAQIDYVYVSDRTDPAATAVAGPSFRIATGSTAVTRVDAPLAPRPATTTTTTAATSSTTSTPPSTTTAGQGHHEGSSAALPIGATVATAAAVGAVVALRRRASRAGTDVDRS